MTNAQWLATRDLYLGQLALLVLSTKLTPAQTGAIVQDLMNIGEMDKTNLMVATDGPVQDIVAYTGTQETFPVYTPARVLTCTYCEPGAYDVRFWQAYTRFHTPGAGSYLPIMAVNGGRLTITGIALFAGYRYAGVLTGPAILGFTYGHGLIVNNSLAFPPGRRTFALQNIKATERISATLIRGLPHFSLQVHVIGLADTFGPINQSLYNLAIAKITGEVEQAIAASQRMGADPFGFGEVLAYQYPQAFTRYTNWNAEYKKVKVQVRVDIRSLPSNHTIP